MAESLWKSIVEACSETNAWKFTAALWGGLLLEWRGLPVSTRALFWMIVLDVALGAWANRREFSASKLVLGFFGKLFACMVMVAALTLMQWGAVVSWDLAGQFTTVATLFELGSVIQSYSKLRAPGARWLNEVYARLRAIAAAAPEELTQADVSARLEASKQTGTHPS